MMSHRELEAAWDPPPGVTPLVDYARAWLARYGPQADHREDALEVLMVGIRNHVENRRFDRRRRYRGHRAAKDAGVECDVKTHGAGDGLSVVLHLRVQCPLSGEWTSVEVEGERVLSHIADKIDAGLDEFIDALDEWSGR